MTPPRAAPGGDSAGLDGCGGRGFDGGRGGGHGGLGGWLGENRDFDRKSTLFDGILWSYRRASRSYGGRFGHTETTMESAKCKMHNVEIKD